MTSTRPALTRPRRASASDRAARAYRGQLIRKIEQLMLEDRSVSWSPMTMAAATQAENPDLVHMLLRELERTGFADVTVVDGWTRWSASAIATARL